MRPGALTSSVGRRGLLAYRPPHGPRPPRGPKPSAPPLMTNFAVVSLFFVTTATRSPCFSVVAVGLASWLLASGLPRMTVLLSSAYVFVEPSLAASVRLVALTVVTVPGVTLIVSGL